MDAATQMAIDGQQAFAMIGTLLWTALRVGALLMAMPLTLCLVVLGRHVDKLEFLDVLFGNTPALTPVK